MRARGYQFPARAAFSLVELLVAMCCIGVLLSLSVPAVNSARLGSARLKCLTQTVQLHASVVSYSNTYRGYFPASVSDSASSLSTFRGADEFRTQAYCQLEDGPLIENGFVGDTPTTRRCPRSQVRLWPEPLPNWGDYQITTSAYIDPSYLREDVKPERWNTMLGGSVQQVDSAVFPSAKAMIFEQWVWHAAQKPILRNDPLNPLQPNMTAGVISITFIDGHAEQLKSAQLQPAVFRAPIWGGDVLSLTRDGFRGRDR